MVVKVQHPKNRINHPGHRKRLTIRLRPTRKAKTSEYRARLIRARAEHLSVSVMFPVTLKSSPYHALDLRQRDYDGQPLSPSKVTRAVSQVPIHCSSSDRTIDVAFHVRGEVPLSETEQAQDTSTRSMSVAAVIARSTFALLPRLRRWEWYGAMDIAVTEPFEVLSSSTSSLSAEVNIFPELAEALCDETKMRRQVADVFEKAKRFLMDYMGRSLYGVGGEIRSVAQFIEECRARELWTYGAFMDDNRYKALMPYITRLLKLKDASHPNVKDSDRVRDMLFSYHCPTYWAAPPPQPTHYSLERFL